MGKEIELKFRATPEILQNIENAYPGTYDLWKMRTDYYDTPEGAFSHRKWMIRCRKENDRAVCTLKTPGDGLGRNEWETAGDDVTAAAEVLAAESGLPEVAELARKGLVVRCGASFTRRCRILDLADARVELALDEGVLTGGGRELPFAEAELELKSGSEATLLEFARKLQREFCLTEETRSKFARAKALGKEK